MNKIKNKYIKQFLIDLFVDHLDRYKSNLSDPNLDEEDREYANYEIENCEDAIKAIKLNNFDEYIGEYILNFIEFILDFNYGQLLDTKLPNEDRRFFHFESMMLYDILEQLGEKDYKVNFSVCSFCNSSTSNEYYMVKDEIWNVTGFGQEDNKLCCIRCLEEKLGRKLNKNDFTDAPCNKENTNTGRLKERLSI